MEQLAASNITEALQLACQAQATIKRYNDRKAQRLAISGTWTKAA